MVSFDLLDRAAGEFAKRLRTVTPAQYVLPTPCKEYDVRALVSHVVGANRMATILLNGGSREDATAVFRTDVLGANWVEAFNGSYRTMYDAFRRKGALERVVPHPAFDMPAEQLFNFRVADMTIHGWDLARAIGADEGLNGELVAELWAQLEPMGEGLKASGAFGGGASGTVPSSASTQTRLLDLTGRRP